MSLTRHPQHLFVTVPEQIAAEAGYILLPVLVEEEVWADCVRWGDAEQAANPDAYQDEEGRLWDLLWMSSRAVRAAGRVPTESGIRFLVFRVPATHPTTQATSVTLAVCTRVIDGATCTVIARAHEH